MSKKPLRIHLNTKYKILNTKRKLRTWIFLGIFLILAPVVFFNLFQPSDVAAWWNDSWRYRIKTTITNSATPLTDFQVAITLDTATLITAGKMQTDCDDIRVAMLNGAIQKYWVENCNASATKIWLKMNFAASEAKVMYVYYGNPNAMNMQAKGFEIFEFFDDFLGNGVDTTKWTVVDGTGISVAGGNLTATSTTGWLESKQTFNKTNNPVVEAKVTTTSFPTNGFVPISFWASTSNAWGGLIHPGTNMALYHRNNSTWTSLYNSTTVSGLVVKLIAESDSTNDIYYYNASSYATVVSATNVSNSVDNEPLRIIRRSDDSPTYYGQSMSASWDWVRSRKYAASEPTSSNASEEIATTSSIHWRMDEGYGQQIASPLTVNEQQITILDRFYQQPNYPSSGDPDDNSLGIVHWDEDQYPGATVYFEAVIRGTGSTGGPSFCAYLYTTSGSQAAAISTTSTNWTRVRSGALSLTDDTDYTVRVSCGGNLGGTWYTQIIEARLIVIQQGAKITSTQSQINLGTGHTTSTNSYELPTNTKYYYYDSSKFAPTVGNAYLDATIKGGNPTIAQKIEILNKLYQQPSYPSTLPNDNSLGIVNWDADKYPDSTVYFEAVIRGTGSTGGPSFCAYLYDTTGNQITNVSTKNTTWTRVRSGALSLTDGTNYSIRVGCGGNLGGTWYTQVRQARLVVIQSNNTKITTTSTPIELGTNQAAFTNTTASELTNYKIYQYDQNQFSPTPESSGDVSFNASLKIDNSLDTAYAELYNLTNSTVVATVSHTGDTNWTLKSTTNVDGDADWDTTNDDEYIVRVYCADGEANGCSGNIANAKILLDQSDVNGITDLEMVHPMINYASTDADTTYTTQEAYTLYNPNIQNGSVEFNAGNFTYYFETTLKTSAGTGYAMLYNTTAGATTNSEISTTSTSYVRQRSSDLTAYMPTIPTVFTATNFGTQLKNSATNTTTASGSTLIIDINSLSTSSPVTAYAELYNVTDGTSVSGSEISSTTTAWSRTRSSSFTLTTGKEYAVRVKSSTNNYQTMMMGAQLILNQNDQVNGLAKTQNVFNLASANATDTDSTYTSQSRLINYAPSNLTATFLDAYFEATLKTSAGTGYAQLTGGGVSGSEVSTASTSFTRVRSSNIFPSLPAAATDMDMQVKNSASNTTTVSNSFLIINRSNVISSGTRDSASNLYHADINGASWAPESDCKFGKCLNFDGVNDYAFTSDANGLDYGTSSFSISLWFKSPPKTSGTGVMLGKFHTTGSDGGYKIYMDSDGDVVAGIDDDSTSFPEDSISTTSANYDDNKWHHVIFVKNGTSSIGMYIDNILIGTDASLSSTGSLSNGDRIYLGIDGDGSSNPYKGYLDDVKIYPYLRSEEEIKKDFQFSSADEGTSGTFGEEDVTSLTGGLAAYWKMDEKTANSCTGGANDSCDSSGFGNDAAWSGDTAYTDGKYGGGVNLDGTGDNASVSSVTGIPEALEFGSGAWTKRIKITFDNSASSENLTDFPVLVKLNSSRINYADTQNSGQDIRFFDSDNTTTLPYEIEKWDEAGDSFVWVKVPQIDLGSTTDYIYMYYGNPTATDVQAATGVWNSNYQFTSHLSTGSGTVIDDSTSNAIDGTINTATWTAGKIGTGLSLNGTSDYATLPDNSLIDFAASSDFTVSFWAKDGAGNISGDALIEKWAGSGSYPYVFRYNANNGISFARYNGTNNPGVVGTTTVNGGNWYYITGVRSGGSLYLYINGALENPGGTTDTATGTTTNTSPVYLGRRGGSTTTWWAGVMDEMRISDNPKSQSWIGADYKSTSDTLNTYASAESVNAALDEKTGWSNKVKITFNNSSATENLINFPVLIKLNGGRVNYSRIRNSGEDIRFYGSDNLTPLPYEIEKWDEAGDSFVWVKVPQINSGSTTDYIYMYYGNATVNDGQSPGEVWNSNYKTVYHLGDISGTSTDDATSNNLNGTKVSETEPNPYSPGIVGGAQDFDGSNDYIAVGNTGLTSQAKTLSMWVNADDLNNDRRILSDSAFSTRFNGSNVEVWSGAAWASALAAGAAGTWTHYTYAFNGAGSVTLYKNGVAGTARSAASWSGTLGIGDNFGVNGTHFNGKIDEVKISNIQRSASWIMAEYKSESDTFISAWEESQGTGYAYLTLSTWVKADTLGAINRVIIARNNSSAYSWALYNDAANPGKLKFTTDGSTNSGVSNATLSTNQWYHVILVVEGTKLKLYINGVLDKEITTNGFLPSTGSISIGADPDGTDGWDGVIDEVRIFARSFNDREVRDLYNFAPGPVGYWTLDENTGSTANDSSGNSNTGTISDSTSWQPGRFGGGLNMDGSSDKITVSDSDSLDLSHMGLSAWVKFNNLNSQTIIDKDNGSYSNYSLWYSGSGGSCGSNVLCFSFRATNGTTQSHDYSWTPTLNQWYHVSATYDGANVVLYINSKAVLTEAQTLTPLTGTGSLYLGSDRTGAGNYINGNVDEVKIFNYGRAPSQVIEDFNGGHPIGGSPIASQLAYYKFDEQNGQTVNNSGNGGSSINGTLGTNSSAASDDPTWKTNTNCRVNGCLQFDGSADYVNVGDVGSLGTTYSVSAWVYPTDTTAEIVSSYRTNTLTTVNNVALQLDITSGTPRFIVRDNAGTIATASSSQTISANSWYHLLGIRDGNNIYIYVNGLRMGTASASFGSITMNHLTHGAYYNDAINVYEAFFNGYIDELKIYSAALTQEEINIDYNGGLSTSFGVGVSPEASQLADGAGNPPITYWKMDEKTDNTCTGGTNDICDSSGNGRDGAISSTTWTDGKYGGALSFNGSSSSVDLGTTAFINQDTSFSISSWVNTNSGTTRTIYSEQANPADSVTMALQVTTSGYANFQIHDGTNWHYVTGTNSISDGRWHHIEATFSNSTGMILYVDGAVADTDPNTNVQQPARKPRIGYYLPANGFFDGKVDDVKIYDYTRTPAQVAYDYNRGEPHAYWKFDECTDTVANDSSGNGYTGTITPGSLDNTAAGNCTSGTATHMWNDGADGKYNGSLGYDGSDDYTTVTDNTNLRFDSATQDFSTATWIKRSANGEAYVLSKEDADNDGWRLGFNSSNNVVCSVDAIDITSTSAITDTSWHHIACVIDRDGNGKIYIDGKTNGSAVAISSEAMANISALKIGGQSYTTSLLFTGLIDDIRIYNYALSSSQILKLLNEGTGVRFGPRE